MEWTNERVEELRRLWSQGQTASRIAELLGGITRNAVIGKAHRLGLCGRPSPIRREEGAPRREAALRASPPPITAGLSGRLAGGLSSGLPGGLPDERPVLENSSALPPAAAEPPAPPPIPGAVAGQPKAGRGGRSCSWPVGDPKQPGFHFCGDEALPGRPYCAAHCAVAYQRKTDAAA
jgi:GcrA cell cycle regulator